MEPEEEESSDDSDSMFEWELDSQDEEEKKEFDYDFSKQEYFNPVVVKGPDGTVLIGTESKDKNSKEALCWNCQTHLIYRNGANKVRCFKCKMVNDTTIINKEEQQLHKCISCKCDLMVPKNIYKIYCSNCNIIFVSKTH